MFESGTSGLPIPGSDRMRAEEYMPAPIFGEVLRFAGVQGPMPPARYCGGDEGVRGTMNGDITHDTYAQLRGIAMNQGGYL